MTWREPELQPARIAQFGFSDGFSDRTRLMTTSGSNSPMFAAVAAVACSLGVAFGSVSQDTQSTRDVVETRRLVLRDQSGAERCVLSMENGRVSFVMRDEKGTQRMAILTGNSGTHDGVIRLMDHTGRLRADISVNEGGTGMRLFDRTGSGHVDAITAENGTAVVAESGQCSSEIAAARAGVGSVTLCSEKDKPGVICVSRNNHHERGFIVMGKDGKERASMLAKGDDSTRIGVQEVGTNRAMALQTGGGSGGLRVMDGQVCQAAYGWTPDSVGLQVFDAKRAVRASLEWLPTAKRTRLLMLGETDNTSGCEMTVADSEALLRFKDTEGHVRVSLGTPSATNPGLELSTKSGKPAASITTNQNGAGSSRIIGANGELLLDIGKHE